MNNMFMDGGDTAVGWDSEDMDAILRDRRPASPTVGGAPIEPTRSTPSRTPAHLHTPPALALEPDILARFVAEIASVGVAGERRAAQLIYLVVVSRFLPRIVSLAVKGPSAGGKSFLVQTVLKYFPQSAYHALTAMSERALAYDPEPLQHRMLVLYEAEGMAGDMQSYLIRSLLSEGVIRYSFVEKTKEGLHTKLIEREGPTGLIVTTTAVRLHPENETRLLSITVSDTPDQTAAVLRALAGGTVREGDVETWHELHEWIADGPTDVTVPYAAALAAAIPPVAVRLRRDFSTVLSLIGAHALLHRANREIVDEVVVATMADYSAVRELVVDLVSDAVGLTVPESIRETVRKVADLTLAGGETSIAKVSAALALDRSSAQRRVKASIDGGYVKNLEEKRGLPSRLALGDPLPSDVTILPTVADLGGVQLCSDAEGGRHQRTEREPGQPVTVPSRTTATVQPLVPCPTCNHPMVAAPGGRLVCTYAPGHRPAGATPTATDIARSVWGDDLVQPEATS